MTRHADQLPRSDTFLNRHIDLNPEDSREMLETIGCDSLDALIDQTVPASIRLKEKLFLEPPLGEVQYLQELRKIAGQNRCYKSYIGLGYYGCITPPVIQRNMLENPGWYTAYTPYQAEISQGRLEVLLTFQTMVSDLTGLEIANASLLDEGTAAAEAMTMLHRGRDRQKAKLGADTFWVSDKCFPQTIAVMQTRAKAQQIDLKIGSLDEMAFGDDVYGILIQYPDADGSVQDLRALIERAHQAGVFVAVASDLLALTVLTPPGEMGADVVLGSAQRFGVPMGYGGPHAAFFAAKADFKRHVPGRIIGVSKDRHGQLTFRMALQTREQHIRRERATSNICTAQALLANMAAMYAVYHGPEGLRRIAKSVHARARQLQDSLSKLGYRQLNQSYFDTLRMEAGKERTLTIRQLADEAELNFRYTAEGVIGIALDETTDSQALEQITAIFAKAAGGKDAALTATISLDDALNDLPRSLLRTSEILTHPVFHRYHTETKLMRYLKRLENKDLSLTTSMIPLGSCTMKLNAAAELMPITWPEFADLHPFAPTEQAKGYQKLFHQLEEWLCKITGLKAVSFQPNSGAQGEFTGMMVIKAYLEDIGQPQRNVALIPSSAHGTNPASAVMAGLKVVIVQCDPQGNIDVEDLKAKAEQYRDTLAALMVTYPSTHGVFEEAIREICRVVHDNGGQVYMDGANLNAQMGLTSPGYIGADVCHLNLHKTFAIPHGGGGPGMGPIAVAEHLTPYLPVHPLSSEPGEKAIGAVSSAHWGSAGILPISHAYIRMSGGDGLTESTRYAILNANYIKARLEKYYPVLYSGKNGRVAHELIFDCRPFKQAAGVEVEDIAKRLMDYGFHAPTISFPVPGTMMVEPTESESKEELDRFCDALIAIHGEIEEIASGKADREDNLLKNAPHTAEEVSADVWEHPYSRQRAAFPLPYLREYKYWPPVARIDNAYGDRNLVCTCPPVEAYENEA